MIYSWLPTSVRDKFADYREKLVDAIVLGVPLGIITAVNTRITNYFIAAPYRVIWIVLPLVVVALVAWRLLHNRRLRFSDWRLLLFWSTYCAAFALASTSELAAWHRLPKGLTQAVHIEAPSLLPAHWGDWRYLLVRRPSESVGEQIAVLLVDQSADSTLERLRYRDSELIKTAGEGNAGGVVLDFAYQGGSRVDELFCETIKKQRHVLVSAYEMRKVGDLGYERVPPVSRQPGCLLRDHQGHAMGLADPDGVVRGIPLFWEDPRRDHPSLSWKFTYEMATERKQPRPKVPPDLFLRLLPPPDSAVRVYKSQADFDVLSQHPDLLSGLVVVIGDSSSRDRFLTPFGPLPGAQIHAYAIYDLLTGYAITRCPWFLADLLIFATCFVLVLLARERLRARQLFLAAAVMSTGVILLAAAAMYFLNVWLDVIYAIAGLWLLVPLLLILQSRWSPAASGAEATLELVADPGQQGEDSTGITRRDSTRTPTQ